jgi:hypothetical protein
VIQHLIINLACFIVVTGLYVRTVVSWVRRYGFNLTDRQFQRRSTQSRAQRRGMTLYGGQHVPQYVHQRQAKALWRLLAILLFFNATWLVVLVNDIDAVRRGRHSGLANTGMGDAPSTFMVCDLSSLEIYVLNDWMMLTPTSHTHTTHRRWSTPSFWATCWPFAGAAGAGSARPPRWREHAATTTTRAKGRPAGVGSDTRA